jgi:cold shock CspA family protein
MRGRVKTYSQRGFGFLTLPGGGADVFFHISIWPSDLDPERDQEVDFEIVTDAKSGKPRATNLRLV